MSTSKAINDRQLHVLGSTPSEATVRLRGGWAIGDDGRTLRALERRGLVRRITLCFGPVAKQTGYVVTDEGQRVLDEHRSR